MKTIAATARTSVRPAAPPRRLLLVDDDRGTSAALARLLSWNGFEVEVAPTAAEAFAALARSRPDIVLTDLMLPDDDGREVIRRARGLNPRPHCLMLTGWPIAGEADVLGIDHVFAKPLEFSTLLSYLAGLP